MKKRYKFFYFASIFEHHVIDCRNSANLHYSFNELMALVSAGDFIDTAVHLFKHESEIDTGPRSMYPIITCKSPFFLKILIKIFSELLEF